MHRSGIPCTAAPTSEESLDSNTVGVLLAHEAFQEIERDT